MELGIQKFEVKEFDDGLDGLVKRKQERAFKANSYVSDLSTITWIEIIPSVVQRFLYAEFEMLVKQLVRDACKGNCV